MILFFQPETSSPYSLRSTRLLVLLSTRPFLSLINQTTNLFSFPTSSAVTSLILNLRSPLLRSSAERNLDWSKVDARSAMAPSFQFRVSVAKASGVSRIKQTSPFHLQ